MRSDNDLDVACQPKVAFSAALHQIRRMNRLIYEEAQEPEHDLTAVSPTCQTMGAYIKQPPGYKISSNHRAGTASRLYSSLKPNFGPLLHLQRLAYETEVRGSVRH